MIVFLTVGNTSFSQWISVDSISQGFLFCDGSYVFVVIEMHLLEIIFIDIAMTLYLISAQSTILPLTTIKLISRIVSQDMFCYGLPHLHTQPIQSLELPTGD